MSAEHHPPHDAEDGTGQHRPRPPGPAAEFIRPAAGAPAGLSETVHSRAAGERLDDGDD